MKLNMERKLELTGFNTSSTFDQIILSCTGSEEEKYRVSAEFKDGGLMFDEVYEDTLDAIMTFRHKLDGFLKGGYQEVKEFSPRVSLPPNISIGTGGAGGGSNFYIKTYITDHTEYQEGVEYFGAGGSCGWNSSYGQSCGGSLHGANIGGGGGSCHQNTYTVSSCSTATLNDPSLSFRIP
jgi:hypothetical protein